MIAITLLLLAALAIAASIYASVSDVARLHIPNACSLVIIAAFAVAFALDRESFGAWWEPFAGAFAMFVVTYVMFAFNMMGGGDSKIASALALWVGLHGMLFYVFYMLAGGGLVAAVSLYVKKRKPFAHPKPESWIGQVQAGRNAVPYGVAISIGAWAAFFHTGMLHQQLDEVFKLIHS